MIGEGNCSDGSVKRNVLAYLADLKQQISLSREMAEKHATAVQDKTKKWYDRKSSAEKNIQPNEKVLVLIPDDTRKLFARWSEPITVLRRVNERNYELALGNGTLKIFHVNKLRRYNERIETIALVVTVDTEENYEDSFIPAIRDDDVTDEVDCSKFKIETSLPQEQKDSLRNLLVEFKDVFRPTLGQTPLAVHHIRLRDTTPCVRPAYRIPQALQQPLQEEINRLLAMGVIRHCQSSYRAPLIPIRKRDNTIRIVNDFSLLNSRCHDDLFPMSNANDVLALSAGKLWTSKIDLAKSYYQVPLASESQPLTAFQTEDSVYCYTRMPQGCKNAPRTLERLLKNLLKGTSSFAHNPL